MLDVQMIESMPHGTIFASGTAIDDEDGLFMDNTRQRLFWVAVRGGGPLDWAIYCMVDSKLYKIMNKLDFTRLHGDKVASKENIKMLVPCTDEAHSHYRR